MVEIAGYIGSLLVAISLLMNNAIRLRFINMIGALVFVFYGLAIKAYAVFAVNLFIAIVDFYYIYTLKNKKDIFKFIKTSPHDEILKHFLSYNARDIALFSPGFFDVDIEKAECFLIMRNLSVIGAFIFFKENKTVKVVLDYLIADCRDFKAAGCFYNSSQAAQEFSGFEKILVETDNARHIKYLELIGFSQSASNPMLFEKSI